MVPYSNKTLSDHSQLRADSSATITTEECPSSTHLGVDAGAGQFVLDDHDDDAEHAHDEGVVADTFPLLEQGLPSAQPVADVGLVLGAGPDAAGWALQLATGDEPAVLHVPWVLGVDANKGDAGVLAGPGGTGATATAAPAAAPCAAHAAPTGHAAAVLHRPRDRESRHWLP